MEVKRSRTFSTTKYQMGAFVRALFRKVLEVCDESYEEVMEVYDIEDEFLDKVGSENYCFGATFFTPSLAYHRNVSMNGLYSSAIKITYSIYNIEEDYTELFYRIIVCKNDESRDKIFDTLVDLTDMYGELFNTVLDFNVNVDFTFTKRNCLLLKSEDDEYAIDLFNVAGKTELYGAEYVKYIYDKSIEREGEIIDVDSTSKRSIPEDTQMYYYSVFMSVMVAELLKSFKYVSCSNHNIGIIAPNDPKKFSEPDHCELVAVPGISFYEKIFKEFSENIQNSIPIDASNQPPIVHALKLVLRIKGSTKVEDRFNMVILVNKKERLDSIFKLVGDAFRNALDFFENDKDMELEITETGAVLLKLNGFKELGVKLTDRVEASDFINIPSHKDREVFDVKKTINFKLKI